jgi:glycosyltransferase 2 family protein
MKFKLLKIALSLVIIGLIFFSIKDVSWGEVILNVKFRYLPIIFASLILALLLRAWRWQILMNDGDVKVSLGFSIKLLFIGQALNIVMPSGAGEVAKGYFGYKEKGMKERMFGVSLFDKIMAVSSIGFLGFYSSFETGNFNYLLLSTLVFIPLLIVSNIGFFYRFKWIFRFIKFIDQKFKRIDIKTLLDNFRFSKRTTLHSLIISVFSWFLTYIMLYYCFLSFTNMIEVEKVFVHSPIITLARLFPFTLNGLGTDEALMMFLFSKNAQSDNLIPLILLGAFYYRLILIFIPAFIGLFIIQKS